MTNLEKSEWLEWHKGLDESLLEETFGEWQILKKLYINLQEIINRLNQIHNVDLLKSTDYLTKAADRLNFKRDYRVVIVGDSGAGKSTLINAIVQQDLLPRESGNSVTGTSIRIRSDSNLDSGKVFINIKKEDEFFISLLKKLAERGNLTLFSGEEEITPDFILNQLSNHANVIDREVSIPDWITSRLPEELEDIAKVWLSIREGKHENQKVEYELSQKPELENLLKESSSLNKLGSKTRIIPAIEYAEYQLPAQRNAVLEQLNLEHITLIDTPGVNATTLRHYEVLHKEIDSQPEAVILVIRADRPGANALQMAYLLENVLLADFNDREKTDFAKKVFLVVNKADQLLSGEGNNEALTQEIKRISHVISSDYYKTYVEYPSSNLRYFKTMALLSLLSVKENHTSNDENLYQSQIKLFGDDGNGKPRDWFNEQSQVPNLIKQLNQFLSGERVSLILREVKSYLRNAVQASQLSCKAALAHHGLKEESFTYSQNDIELYIQDRCVYFLELDLQACNKLNQELRNQIYKRLNSNDYQETIAKTLKTVLKNLKDNIQIHLSTLINNFDTDSDEKFIYKSFNYLLGEETSEGLPRRLLIKIEREFHKLIEEESEHIASCYINLFENAVQAQGIFNFLQEKSYGQKYVNKIFAGGNSPEQRIKQKQEEICLKYKAACRWILIYEIIKMPITSKYNFTEISTSLNILQVNIEELTPIARNAISETLTRIALSPWDVFLDEFIKADSQSENTETTLLSSSESFKPKSTVVMSLPKNQESESLSSNEFKILDTYELVNKISEFIEKNNFKQMSSIIIEQFTLRYSIAIGATIKLLERLFQYEMGEYCMELSYISERLINQHISLVRSGNEEIRNVILNKNSTEHKEIQELFECLKNLDDLKSQGIS